MKPLKTASGKANFEYGGNPTVGIELRYGSGVQQNVRVSPEIIDALIMEFSARPNSVVVGTSFSDPPLGSIGDWLREYFGQNIACYLVPAFEDLGLGDYDRSRRQFRFTAKIVELGSESSEDVAARRNLTDSLDGAFLAAEAGKAMLRTSTAVSKLPLSPARRIECTLSDFRSAEEFHRHLARWGLPTEGEFVIYRFQTEDVDDFHSAFPEKSACSYRLSRKNELTEDGVTLYVGSSRDFSSRLQQHFGYGYEGTYALHLKRWVPERLWRSPLLVEYWTVRDSEGTRPIVFQAVEDYLWDHSRPIFGRRGAK